jgi:hypothetical protein
MSVGQASLPICSTDNLAHRCVGRFGLVITYLAIVTVAFGVLIAGVGTLTKMPTYWTLAEGPPTFVIGSAILLLNRRVQRDVGKAATNSAREDSRASERWLACVSATW